MFKRVAKRQKKREKEEDLGIDEEMKQVFGLQDTDSDESTNSSDSDSDDRFDIDSDSGEETGDEDVDPTEHLRHKPKLHTQRLASFDSDGLHDDSERSDHEDEADKDDEDDPPMGVMAATTDPIYDLPNSPQTLDLRACIVCPGKVIKNSTMAKIHLESSAHRRRLQRYAAEVTKRVASREGLDTDDPRDILRDMSGTVNYGAPDGSSKRSQRRALWKNKLAERKKSQKEKRKKMSVNRSEEIDHQNSGGGGTIKQKVKKLENDGNVPGLSTRIESSRGPKPDKKQQKTRRRSGLVKPNLDDNPSPQKRPKRKG